MIKAIIIDDEQYCLDALQVMLNRFCKEIEIVDTCLDGESGVVSIEKHNPQLVFLDIAMPKMDGFEMLDMLENIEFEVIFTTAYDNFAIQAFKVNAIDYILKPIDRLELIAAVEKVKQIIQLKSGDEFKLNNKIELLLSSLKSNNEPINQISIPTLAGLEIIKTDDILYVKGEGNYSKIFVKNKSPLMISKTIKYIENKLQNYPFFFRIHQSSYINLKEMKQYYHGKGGYIVMSDGKSLTVARHRKKALLQKLEYYQ